MSLDEMVIALVEERLPTLVAAEVQRHAENAEIVQNLPEVMTSAGVAEALQCSLQHVSNLVRSRALKGKKDGNRYLFLREWVLDYVQSDRTVPAMDREARRRLAERNSRRTSRLAQP